MNVPKALTIVMCMQLALTRLGHLNVNAMMASEVMAGHAQVLLCIVVCHTISTSKSL